MAVDLQDVLFSEGKSVALAKLADAHGSYDGKLTGAIPSSPRSILLRKGLVADNDFRQQAQQRLASYYDAEVIKHQSYDGDIRDEGIDDLVAILRKKFSVVAFLGNIESRIAYLEAQYLLRPSIDIEVYCVNFHMAKPERVFVESRIAKSGVRPEEIVYIDQQASHVQSAQDLAVRRDPPAGEHCGATYGTAPAWGGM